MPLSKGANSIMNISVVIKLYCGLDKKSISSKRNLCNLIKFLIIRDVLALYLSTLIPNFVLLLFTKRLH